MTAVRAGPKPIWCVKHKCWLFQAENCNIHRRSELATGVLKSRRAPAKRTAQPKKAVSPVAAQPEVPTAGVAVPATLGDILAGKFPSALDKSGSNGTLVKVTGLSVLDVTHEADGDFHIAVTDGTVPRFIAELTPPWQQKGLEPPSPGSKVDITGFVFADEAHAAEAWHGSTAWEIHPITALEAAP